MRRRSWGQLVRLRGVLVLTILILDSSMANAQAPRRPPRGPLPSGPWDQIGRDDPLDEAAAREANERKAQEYYDAGVKLLEKGRIQAAKTKFRSVVELVGTNGSGGAALGQLVEIHNEGMRELDKVLAACKEGKYVEALQLAKKTKVLYPGILDGMPGMEDRPNIAQLAAAVIKQLERDPRAREAIQEHEAAKRFKKLPSLEAAAKSDPRKHLDLYKTLKSIAKHFPDCPTGRSCAERLAGIKADKKLYKSIRKEEDRRLIASTLQQAEQYESYGLKDLAAAEREKLKKRFPGKSLEDLRRLAKS